MCQTLDTYIDQTQKNPFGEKESSVNYLFIYLFHVRNSQNLFLELGNWTLFSYSILASIDINHM